MTELLKANVTADLAYFRRSRLLIAFILLFLLITGLQSLPPLFAHSGVQSFNTLQETFSNLNFFLLVFAAGLGLFIISSHLRSRNLKMVFTKPCSPALWLASAFLTALLVSLFVSCVVLASMTVLSLFWHIPVRGGLAFVSLDTFAASIGLIAYMMLLAMVANPAIAVVFAIVFNPAFFYNGLLWAQATIHAGSSSWTLHALAHVFRFLYWLLPMVHPFSAKTSNVYTSLRVTPGDWKYLAYSLGYSLTLSTFCYLLALLALQKKKHI